MHNTGKHRTRLIYVFSFYVGLLFCFLIIVLGNSKNTDGAYIRWYLRNGSAHKEQSLLFDLFKALDKIESSTKSGDFFQERLFSFIRKQHFLSYHLKYHVKIPISPFDLLKAVEDINNEWPRKGNSEVYKIWDTLFCNNQLSKLFDLCIRQVAYHHGTCSRW